MNEHKILPLIPLRGIVVFPYMLLHFDVVRKKSILAIEQAMAADQLIFVSSQKDTEIENPSAKDINEIGTVVRIKQMLKMPGDVVRVLVEGMTRGRISDVISESPFFTVCVERINETPVSFTADENEALRRRAVDVFEKFSEAVGKIAPETVTSVSLIDNIPQLSDVIAAASLVRFEQKQEILSECNAYDRLIILMKILADEIEIFKIEKKISAMVKGRMDKNQKEYFLREQLKAIESELGDSDGTTAEIADYKKAFDKLELKDSERDKIDKEINRLKKMQSTSAEAGVIRGYLDLLLELPWGKKTKDCYDIQSAKKILDAEHFGLDDVKQRIIEFLSVKKLTSGVASPILCLVGPPGVGKTSVASSIARALNRKFSRMSLGGVRDEAEIRGHRKTYIGAMPGRIINAIKNAGSDNALILLDEIDKMSSDFKGDPSSALLEVLDSEQNSTFRDHYVELHYDLSDTMFVTTANSLDTISKPLLDRMEVIEISGYTDYEKFEIAKRHLIPKQRSRHGLNARQLKINDSAIYNIIQYYTRESGVRNLERYIAKICRKAAVVIASADKKSVSVTTANLTDMLGAYKYLSDEMERQPQIGVATGLAWTSVGGVILPVEVNVMKGSGKIELTGQLGDVMKESAKAAISYIRANAEELGIQDDFYDKNDIHIHFPEGATPKDGPSAGITMATAILSALSKRAVRNTIAMTGEITLRGRVLAIGGLKEKALAAYRAGIRTVIIPEDNKRDIGKIPEIIRNDIEFIPVTEVCDVFNIALCNVDSELKFKDNSVDSYAEIRQ